MNRELNALGNFFTDDEKELPWEMSSRTSRMTIRKHGILGLVLQGLKALHEGKARGEERGQLLREHGQLAQGQFVALGLFLEALLLRELLRGANALGTLLETILAKGPGGGGGGGENCHDRFRTHPSQTRNPICTATLVNKP